MPRLKSLFTWECVTNFAMLAPVKRLKKTTSVSKTTQAHLLAWKVALLWRASVEVRRTTAFCTGKIPLFHC